MKGGDRGDQELDKGKISDVDEREREVIKCQAEGTLVIGRRRKGR